MSRHHRRREICVTAILSATFIGGRIARRRTSSAIIFDELVSHGHSISHDDILPAPRISQLFYRSYGDDKFNESR